MEGYREHGVSLESLTARKCVSLLVCVAEKVSSLNLVYFYQIFESITASSQHIVNKSAEKGWALQP